MKLLRTIRLDASDVNVFPIAAEPEEWAVPGTFAFVDSDPDKMSRKEQLALASGWLGIRSFGRSTFVQVARIEEADREAVIRDLGAQLVAHCEAPGLLEALAAAREEVAYAAEIAADHKTGALLAIERELTDVGISERVRAVSDRPDGTHAKVWSIEEEPEPGA